MTFQTSDWRSSPLTCRTSRGQPFIFIFSFGTWAYQLIFDQEWCQGQVDQAAMGLNHKHSYLGESGLRRSLMCSFQLSVPDDFTHSWIFDLWITEEPVSVMAEVDLLACQALSTCHLLFHSGFLLDLCFSVSAELFLFSWMVELPIQEHLIFMVNYFLILLVFLTIPVAAKSLTTGTHHGGLQMKRKYYGHCRPCWLWDTCGLEQWSSWNNWCFGPRLTIDNRAD